MKHDLPIVAIPLTCAALAFAVVAVRAGPRSRRLGASSVGCGLAAFVPALLGPTYSAPSERSSLVACGVAALVLALAAIVLAGWTALARHRDRAAAPLYPVAGAAFGVANLFCGAGILATGAGALVVDAANPWTWRSEAHGFEVTVPSDRWVVKQNPNVLAEFTGSRPTVVAIVADARPAASDAEYEAALEYGQKVRRGTPTTGADERTGTNPHGRPYWLYTGEARNGDKPYFFGVSVTRANGKAVLLMFEGPYRLASDAGHAQEAAALREQAGAFLASVR